MLVTMDIYSGVPNPSWELSEADATRLVERVAGRALAGVEEVPPVLGFRGFIISRGPEDAHAEAASLPDSFRLDPQLAAELLPGVRAEETAVAEMTAGDKEDTMSFLLGTAAGAVNDELLEVARQSIARAGQAPAAGAEAAVVAACIIQNPSYNPAFWNAPGVVGRNNCYNFAMNYRSDTFAQPGRISGRDLRGADLR